MKASRCVFNNTAPVWYKNTLIYKSPHCANCHLNPEKSAPLLCYIFFIQSARAVCSNHLDICRRFEATHCLLRVSVHSRPSPRATRRPQLSESRSPRTRRELFGNRWRPERGGGLLTVGGINEGGLWTTTGSPDDAAAGGKTSITGKEWLLLMVWRLLMDNWKSLERRRQRSNC